MNQGPPGPPPASPSGKKGMPTWLIVVLAVAGAMVLLLPIFAVVSIYGIRKYIANAKTAEARTVLGELAKDAAVSYEPKRGFCPSASRPVPATVTSVSGAKYQSSVAEWAIDGAEDAGFACLKFTITEPQYFQYSYVGSKTAFEVVAHGDLNGDGVTSTFRIRGQVGPGAVVSVEPKIEEESPEE